MKKIVKSSIAAFALAGIVTAPAFAGENYAREISKAKANVEVADLDLTAADGREALEKRISKAVKKECRYDVRGQIRQMRDERACRAAANEKLAAEFKLTSDEEALGG